VGHPEYRLLYKCRRSRSSTKVSTGKGDHNIFGDRNVQEARILKALSRYGVPLETVKKIMEVIRKKSPEVLESRELRTFLLLRHKNKRIDIEPVLLDEPVDPQRPLLFVGDMVGADSAIVVNLLE